MSDVTQILGRVEKGDGKAAEELLPMIYEELRKVAAHKMSLQPAGQTLQATALVHEAYLRMVGGGGNAGKAGNISSAPLRKRCGTFSLTGHGAGFAFGMD